MVVTQVYDVVFSPKTLQLAEADKQLRKMVIDTALDGITQRFPIHKLARDNLKFPSLKFKVSGALAGTRPIALWCLDACSRSGCLGGGSLQPMH